MVQCSGKSELTVWQNINLKKTIDTIRKGSYQRRHEKKTHPFIAIHRLNRKKKSSEKCIWSIVNRTRNQHEDKLYLYLNVHNVVSSTKWSGAAKKRERETNETACISQQTCEVLRKTRFISRRQAESMQKCYFRCIWTSQRFAWWETRKVVANL